MKNPIEVQPPSSNRLFVVRVEKSRDRIPFTLFDDFPLDLGHSPAVESTVRKSPGVCIPGPTHVVNCSIALRVD